VQKTTFDDDKDDIIHIHEAIFLDLKICFDDDDDLNLPHHLLESILKTYSVILALSDVVEINVDQKKNQKT
jgi:hypothetical protein